MYEESCLLVGAVEIELHGCVVAGDHILEDGLRGALEELDLVAKKDSLVDGVRVCLVRLVELRVSLKVVE